MSRPNWQEYFMKIAFETASRSSCFSEGKGAVIVKNGRIIATGYNGAPSGTKNCKYDIGICRKREKGYGHGEGHNECKAVHAEANAILSAAKLGISTEDCVMYCTHKPCENCMKMIIQSGIILVFYSKEYESEFSKELAKEAKIKLRKVD